MHRESAYNLSLALLAGTKKARLLPGFFTLFA
jgi:hypothetical protein